MVTCCASDWKSIPNDLDYLNANARSMISPVVCSNIDDFSGLIIKAQGHVVAGQTPLYEIKK